ncbi:hypothetical protein ACFYXC_13680 [Streptomyces sp. NPDC002701]|uniref:hypothetical protein n=1 Tax=Streptomyces sp. NPDC002701 TaxID=3364661 RepID=UPI0036D0B3AD
MPWLPPCRGEREVLSYWDEGRGDWGIPDGKVLVYVGASVVEAEFAGHITSP